MVDTLLYFKKLEAAGFTRQQAEAQVEVVRDFQTDQFPTKAYVDGRFNEIERRLDRLEQRFETMGDKITIRLGGMMIVGFGAMAVLIKLV